jgi:hypothetical protein
LSPEPSPLPSRSTSFSISKQYRREHFPDTVLKVLLPDINLLKELSSLDERQSREWPIGIAAAAGGAGFFAVAFDFDFDSNPLQKEAKGAFWDTVLMDLLSMVNLSKESSLLDERLRIHASKLNLTAIVGGSTHAYNLNKRFIRTRVAVAWDMAPWIGMRHGHLLFVVSNVAGGINSRSSISRAVEALFPFKCLHAYKRQPSCPLLTATMYVSPIHHGCGSLSLSSSIIMKKRRPIIKSRADYKIENVL